ncbi:hypothetical protein [Verrucosispora sp. WMMD1129]|uniref:hypothetical protein n=1 Tax=Verrucosispora sp. WMMD1129 TaxID=3016093 RepID=UPI002499AF15|nr:hypothetical protein [Verrucosispora sp. WMMD1129]WFE45334.1 hypothetical protein O7624_13715 [Verrucosispora sp. WMMD1129]
MADRHRPSIHLAQCDYCGRRIAWSRKRRQWLALNPFTWMRGSQLQRRLRCPSAPAGTWHDPAENLAARARHELDLLFERVRHG